MQNKMYYIHDRLYHYRCWQGSRTHKFDPKIIKLTEIEVNYLSDSLNKYDFDEDMQMYMNYRISTRLNSCMRLYYFNKKKRYAIQ